MATQYTSILKLALPVQGELSGTWGDVVNDNITSMVEEAIAGRKVINTWTTNSHTLTTADGTTSEARAAMLEFTDTGTALTGAATVVCPSDSKLYVCKNDAGQQVTIKTSAGTGVAIPDGETMFVFCDGTNVEQCATNFNSLSYNGYTLNFGGAVTTAGAFTTSGAYSLTLTTTAATDVTLPTTGTLATLAGTETLTNKTLTAPTISSPTLTGSISATDLTISGDTTIGDAAADGLTVNATITSNLIFTDDTYDIGASGATRPRTLYLSQDAVIGDNVSAASADISGAVGIDGDLDVNTDKFTVASSSGNTTIAGTLAITGETTATGNLKVDTINEITAAGGVTVDGVLLKDGEVTTDTINEETAAAGVTVDGVLLKDSQVSTDQINELTSDAGVTVDSLLIKDGDLDVAAGFSISSAGGMNLVLDDDDSSTNTYLDISHGNTPVSIMRVKENGNVEFFETTGATAEMIWNGAQSQLRFIDGIAAAFGTGQDLLIHHTSNQNYIEDTGTGNLNLKSNGNNINFLDGSDNLVFQVDLDSETGLYFNTTRVLQTDAKGLVRIDPTTSTTTTIGELDSRILLLNNTTTNDAGGEIVFGYTDTNVDRYAAISGTADSNGATGGTGSLRFSTKAADADTALVNRIVISKEGNVEFYEDTGANAKMTWEPANELLKFQDDVKAVFGASSDLQIYHTGTDSRIVDGGTGSLFIGGDSFVDIGNSSLSLTRARFSDSTSALYQQGDIKLSTTSSGIDVTGSTTTDGIVNDGTITSVGGLVTVGVDADGEDVRFYGDTTGRYMEWVSSSDALLLRDNSKLLIGNGSDLQLYHDGANNYIEGSTGSIIIQNTNDDYNVIIKSDNGSGGLADYFRANGTTGSALMYHYGTEKLTTTSSGVTISGAVLTDQALIAALEGTISETAVAIYVYDTTQDSDGGNWRKNTRHTSWYNEELNTSTRGARREFPSLAIIVAETSTVTIFDGDDPDLPMWMVFNAGGGKMFYSGGTASQGIVAGNGTVYYGTGGTGAFCQANFIGDEGFLRVTGSNQYNRQSIIRRNASLGDTVTGTVPGLTSRTIQGLAIYIDHNAMVDPATGLPAPYVAIATAASVDVLLPDLGRITAITHNSWGFEHPHFTDKAELLWNRDSSTYYQYRADKWEYGFKDYVASGGGNYIGVASGNPEVGTDAYRQIVGRINDMAATDYGYAISSNSVINTRAGLKGLGLYMRNRAKEGRTMVARITSEFNTGFMPAWCWGAMLADTDDTDVTGSELITNPDFTSNVTSWNNDGTSTITWNSSGYADVDRNGSSTNAGRTTMYQNVSGLTVGACYTVTMRIVTQNTRAGIYIYNSTGNAEIAEYLTDNSDNGASGNDKVYTVSFIATATEHRIGVGLRGSSNATGTIDYVRMRAAEESRVTNSVAPVVFGTVPKQVVNANCDLVSYGPFSSSNYLVRYPAANVHDSSIDQENALDWGTGNFTVMLWFNNTSYTNRQILLRKTDSGDGAGRWALTIETNGKLNFGIEGASGSNLLSANATQYTRNSAVWNQVVITREDNQMRMFVNGHLVADARNGTDLSATAFQQLAIGSLGFGSGAADSTEMALLRIARKPISQEQVKHSYYCELAMFQPTESGTSRKVTIPSDSPGEIAFDPVSKILYGNTNAGNRYALSGLVRYDTTSETASTTIHAYDDLVLDD